MAAALPAAAQLGGLSLPSLPGAPVELNRVPLRNALERELAPLDLRGVRERALGTLLRRERDRLERDPAGAPIVRGEVTLHAPSATLLDAARAAGFSVAREHGADTPDLRIVVLRIPSGVSTAQALEQLRTFDADAAIDFNHLYTGSGEPATGAAPTPARDAAPAAGVRIGLIDGAIDRRHPVLRDARMQVRACERPGAPSAHGTAVASLLVGAADRFRGVVPGATLYAADVQCGDGALDAIADALGWLARERVAVINVSMVGPHNRVLERLVHALATRGHVIVAAVGNDGPAAPPLYPAAYPSVVGVTAVDARQRVLPEALRGPQVAFAAPGADVAVAAGRDGFSAARGTSFAAPVVAGLLARVLSEPEPRAAARAIDALVRDAIDLGAAGRDPVFGHGLIGATHRIDPLALR